MSFLTDDQNEKFILLYQTYVDEIYHFVYLRIGLSETLAQDLTQDIFLDILKGLSHFKGLSTDRTWIYTIARNKVNDFYRKNYRTKFELVDLDDKSVNEIDDSSQDIQANFIHKFECDQVRICLKKLAEPYQIILTFKYIDEMSTKEISRLIHKSPKAVESLLHRARSAFLTLYQDDSEKGRSSNV